ncbi:MAG: methionine adenosyltransferase [Spirochaetaceae bacterium]|nr:methionine adenosyltransferase [Spirochaetaceae bacterium]
MDKYLFTSESVSEGHPDKLCDQISDAVLDECLRQDSNSHVACETFASNALVLVGGEITTEAYVDVQKLVHDICENVGYTDAAAGLDCDSMAILNMIHTQSPDINQGVVGNGLREFEGLQGAGDQGLVFGFACSETSEYMPTPISLAHKILQKASKMRKNGELPYLRPDSKSQVTVEYEGHKPVRIDTVVVSHQHSEDVQYEEIKHDIVEKIVKPVLADTNLLDEKTKFYINPTGRFVIGGPAGDTGLTGRKIIADTYGGMGRHGGGAFSGKDPSKVDRSAAYMARYIAKNIVAAGFAERCEIQLSYAIGVPYPISVMIDTFGTGVVETARLEKAVKEIFDCSPGGIIKTLDLKKPIYRNTSVYGHFGKDGFPWEKTDKVDALKSLVKS